MSGCVSSRLARPTSSYPLLQRPCAAPLTADAIADLRRVWGSAEAAEEGPLEGEGLGHVAAQALRRF